jgi:hypothetical protein
MIFYRIFIEKRIELNKVPASPYGPALGSKVQKNPALIATSGKKS